MPSHAERVRRNYPEGVPQFRVAHVCIFESVYGADRYCIHCGSQKPRYIPTPAEEVAIRAAVAQWVSQNVVRIPQEGHVPYEDNFTIRPDTDDADSVNHRHAKTT